MEIDKYKGVSDEELLKEQKKLQKLNKIYAALLAILVLAAIYLAVAKENFTFIFVSLALFSIFYVNINSLKDFKKEIKKRNLQS